MTEKTQRTETTQRVGDAKDHGEMSSRSSLSSVSSSFPGFIPKHGGYEQLKSYQKALIVYQGTVKFAKKWVSRGSRTCDQMVQAARSGKQNILEGSLASATSKQSEIHLTNVARASLGELREDYEDFLRDQGLPTWDKTHRYAQRVTELSRSSGENYETYRKGIEHDNPEIAANVLRHLTMQATLLLDRQIARLEQDFLREGGIRERMTRARLKVRETEEGRR
jgi:four helix bundle suffix protein